MRCRPYDAAFVTALPSPSGIEWFDWAVKQLIGRVVTVVTPVVKNDIQCWTIKDEIVIPRGPVEYVVEHLPDWCLTPIRGLDEPETITTKEPEHADA